MSVSVSVSVFGCSEEKELVYMVLICFIVGY